MICLNSPTKPAGTPMNVAAAALTIFLSPELSQYSFGLEKSGWRSTKPTVRTGPGVIVFSATAPSDCPPSVTVGAGETTVDGRLVPAAWQPGMSPTARASTQMDRQRIPRILQSLLSGFRREGLA